MKLITNELVPVYETEQGRKVVDGRQLHGFLEVGKDFTTWIKERIQKYNFEEEIDYILTLTRIGERQNVIRHDYFLTIEMAKELCMVENNEQGSKARKYFIEVEGRYKTQAIDISRLSPEMQMFKHVFDGVARIQLENLETKRQLAQVTSTVSVIQETFLQRDEDWRKSINSMLSSAGFRLGGNYRDLRNESYRLLEQRAHCNLAVRLANLIERLEESGATKTKTNNTTRMDVIESDPRLKEIYSSIVKELSIGSLKIQSS